MVSLLWKACSDGNLQTAQDLLKDATPVDVEIKDHTGVTPLIEAVKNGHVEIVRTLLDKGADPTNASSHGRPEVYTSDPVVLELLHLAQSKTLASGIPSHEPVYTPEPNDAHDKTYAYGPQSPPVVYPYYPSLNPVPPPPEGSVYYPQQPPTPQNPGDSSPAGSVNNGNLPPPEVARFIPCRYFPACRYGAACLFAHPPPSYYQGPVPPPAPYPAPYDPMSVQPYPPAGYYPPPPSFQPPPANAPPHMSPLSPPVPHPAHSRSPSEAVMPVQPPPFSPNGVPPSMPYGPISPSAYPHPHPPVPMSISPLPPLPPQVPLPAQSPSNMYNTVPPPLPPFVQHDGTVQYPPTPHANIPHVDVNGDTKPLINPHPDSALPHHPPHRDGFGHHRRGSARRSSFGTRKPPCLFFPLGKCKNGDDCRFPHVLPDGASTHHQPYFSGRGGRIRHVNGNNFAAINEKLASMTIRDDPPQHEEPSASPVEPVRPPRYPHGPKNGFHANGARPERKQPLSSKQRVPNADEFPVLGGTITPPTRNGSTNGVLTNGHGPTAAQVLQAPAPHRKDTSKESTPRVRTPDSAKVAVHKAEPNGVVTNGITHDHSIPKLPVSFAAVAASELPKEITLSA